LGSGIHASAHSWKALSARPLELVRAFRTVLESHFHSLPKASCFIQFSHDFLSETVDFAFACEGY